jgi:hypothetical protein
MAVRRASIIGRGGLERGIEQDNFRRTGLKGWYKKNGAKGWHQGKPIGIEPKAVIAPKCIFYFP